MNKFPAVFVLSIASLAAYPACGEEIDNKTAHAIKTVDSYVLSWQYIDNPYSAKTPPSLKLAVGDLIKLRFYSRQVLSSNDDGSIEGAIYESRCPGSIYLKVPKEGAGWFSKIFTSGPKQARYAFCRVISLNQKIELELLGREIRADTKTSSFVW
jgi:hypothetical protein